MMDSINVTMHDSGFLQINLNRPEQLNALNAAMLQELLLHLKEAKQNVRVKAVLLTGTGKAFCAGADINQLIDLNGPEGVEFARFGQSVFRELELLGKPTLAAIQGFALGGGCELAMAATMRMAATNAFFGQPEIKLGVIPGFGGTQRLARLVGKGRALEMCLTGRRISADEAYHWGLVNALVSPDELLRCASALLAELAQLGPVAIQSVMTVIQQGYSLPIEEALELEAVHFGICCATKDKREGVKAFLEKRPAIFTGE